MRRPQSIAKTFAHLQLVVIDEIHILLDGERGVHVRSLLSRIFEVIGKRPRMVGLSATIGNVRAAQEFINPDNPEEVVVIEDKDDTRELKVAILAHLEPTKTTGKKFIHISPGSALKLAQRLPDESL